MLGLPAYVAATPRQPQATPSASTVDPAFRRLTVAQGLLHPTVRTILQDQRGFMWFGSTLGLNRYDGSTMATLASDSNDPERLQATIIWALATDRDNRIWVGSYTDGLAAYDLRSGQFTRFLHDPQDATSPSANDVTGLLVDRSGVLWVGTASGGLDRRDPTSGHFTHYRHDPANPASLSSDALSSLAQDRAGALWVGTSGGGLNRLDPGTGRFTHYRHDPANPASLSSDNVRSLLVDRTGALWVGTLGSGLSAFDPATGRFTHYRHDPANSASLSNDVITALHEDRAGILWVGTQGGGLNRLDRATGRFQSYRNDPADPLTLPQNSIHALYEDTSGLLWVGTDGGGIGYFRLYDWPFRRYVHRAGQADSLAEGTVRGLAEDRDGSVWVGTFGGGVNRLDPRTQAFVHYRNTPDDPTSLSDDLVWNILVDRDGTPWVTTDGGFLNRFDHATGRFRRYRLAPPEQSYPIMAITQDRAGVLWLGSFGGGLSRFDPATGVVTTYTHVPDDPHSLSDNFIQYVYEDTRGTLWVGTLNGGLNRFDPTTGTFTTYRHDPTDPSSLNSDNAARIVEDQHGSLWVGTTNGLNRFDPTTGSFTHFTEADGLPSNLVQGMVVADGQLWVSTLAGLARFDERTATFRSYDASIDLLSEGFAGNALLRARDGTIYAGGFGGLISFDPAAIGTNTYAPPVVLTDFRINNQPVAIGPESPLQQAINETTALRLRQGERTFSLAFAALDYWSPEQARYRYMLEGVDRDWNEVGSRQRFVTYAKLGPGTYTLHVRAAGRDGSWNGPERTLAITIPPFLWERGWVQLGGLAVFGALGVSLFSLSGYRARARQRKLEAQVALRTRELSVRTEELSAQTRELKHANGRLEAEIAERQRTEDDARRSRDELATQLVISQQIVAMLELDPLLERVLEELEQVEPFDGAAVFTIEGEELVVRVFRSAMITRQLRGVRLDPRRVSRFSTLLATRQPLIVADRTANPEDLAYLEPIIGETEMLRAWMGLPLIVKDRVIGVLTLMHHEVGYYGPAAQARVQLFANQVALAIENARLYAQARAVAVSEERTRIAHDLHDAVSQTLFSASLIAEALPDAVERTPEHARHGANQLQQLTRAALSEMRMLLYELRPAAFSEKPLQELLRSLCAAVASRMRATITLTFEEPCVLQPGEVQTVFYRAVQEALNNVWKHAEAAEVTVWAMSTTDLVEVKVIDNGKGFDLAGFRSGDNALGILRERAAAIGAVLHVVSQPGEGTTVRLSWCPPDNGARGLKEGCEPEHSGQGSMVQETHQPHH
ncbi:MAG: GAF domain-containing protein [Chloroflexales bacterium]|nr:GAF domain-containing protein [Chloroflexales bacterium]